MGSGNLVGTAVVGTNDASTSRFNNADSVMPWARARCAKRAFVSRVTQVARCVLSLIIGRYCYKRQPRGYPAKRSKRQTNVTNEFRCRGPGYHAALPDSGLGVTVYSLNGANPADDTGTKAPDTDLICDWYILRLRSSAIHLRLRNR
jgi:hypothetical protein